MSIRDAWVELRPSQWAKNAVVLAGFFFGYWDRSAAHKPLGWSEFWRALVATLIFCAVSSAVYVVNDIVDAEADRVHPVKRSRPVAQGRINMGGALVLALLLIVPGLAAAWSLGTGFGSAVSGYLLLQAAYNVVLKRVRLVDTMVIAAGFVLRAAAGAVAVGVAISPWLLLCTFLLALFLALCKRRQEKAVVGAAAGAEVEESEIRLLDVLIGVTAAATTVSYALYTLWPDTVMKYRTVKLGLTIPFVIFGIFRYLDLVYAQRKGAMPEKVLFEDTPLLVGIALYVVLVAVIFTLAAPR